MVTTFSILSTKSNLLNHLSDTLQKPFQQIPFIYHKLFHEIVCLIQYFPKLRVFSIQLLILVHNINKLISQGFISTRTSNQIIYHLRNLSFSLQIRCLLLQIHQSNALNFDISFDSISLFIGFLIIVRCKARNLNKYNRNKFEREEIERKCEQKDDKYYQIILMLLYNEVRISEFLDLKKENIHLDEQYFDVISSKIENEI